MKLSRSRKTIINSIMAICLEAVTMICGFILPRALLSSFGSSVNGLVSSITQYLSFLTLMSGGIAGITKAALYKPLANNDTASISSIIRATEIFLRKISILFIFIIFGFALVYPFIVMDRFEWIYTFFLCLILGISLFVQFFFGLSVQYLLMADQKHYIISFLSIITLIVNTTFSIILLKLGCGIHLLKLVTVGISAISPIFLYCSVRKKYHIDPKAIPNSKAISQRWDAFGHTLANYVNKNTDIVILTLFSTLENISVYHVYYMVANGMRKLIQTMTNSIEAGFGNIIAKESQEFLVKKFKDFELLIYFFSTTVFAATAILIVPFVRIYTSGITDADYIQPVFAYIIAGAEFFSCVRLPYQMIVQASGHYKQTRNGAILEAVLNISISLILTWNFGLIGVATGTLIAMGFRTIQYAWYSFKNILHISLKHFIFYFLLFLVPNIGLIIIINSFISITPDSYISWIFYGIVVFGSIVVINLFINLFFNGKQFFSTIKYIRSIVFRKKSMT